MRLSANLNPMLSTNAFSINHAGKNAASGSRGVMGFVSPLQKDSVFLSPQGKTASIIDSLNKQKMAIEDRKNSFMSSALEQGQSMDSIEVQLDSYDEQIKEIDKQIAEINAQQLKAANEKKDTIKYSDNKPKTEQEIQNQKMQNLMKISMGLDKVETIDTVKTKIDGDSAVLESEIELDKMHSNGMPGSLEAIAKKEEQLADMQRQSMELTVEIGEQIVDLTEEIHKNNEPVEKVEDSKTEEDSVTTEDDEESIEKNLDIMSSKIEQYKYMQQMAEAPETAVSLVDASA